MKILGTGQRISTPEALEARRRDMPRHIRRTFYGTEYSGGKMTVAWIDPPHEEKGPHVFFQVEHGCSYGRQEVRIDLPIEDIDELIDHLAKIREKVNGAKAELTSERG